MAGLFCCNGWAQHPGDLDAVLKQMDAGSVKFKSAEANLRQDLYERVIKETTTESGSTYYERTGAGIQVGIRFDSPSSRFIELKDGTIRMFVPKADHLTQISMKKSYESFLALGFGGSGTDLAKQWTITYQGTEALADGGKTIQTVKLDLVGKDESTRNTVQHITIWVDPVEDVSLKQQLFMNDGNIRTAIYSNVRVNQLTKAALDGFAIKTDKKTTVDSH